MINGVGEREVNEMKMQLKKTVITLGLMTTLLTGIGPVSAYESAKEYRTNVIHSGQSLGLATDNDVQLNDTARRSPYQLGGSGCEEC